ncbi:MAG: glycosyltransferase [Planctomycetaceae bacterium]|nr:glycosyltransferase [Planctomycetaceae bacterium]
MNSVGKKSKSALFVIPWVPFPLHSGGAIRAFQLARQLLREFSLEILIPAEDGCSGTDLADALSHYEHSIKVTCVPYRSHRRGWIRRVADKLVTLGESRSFSEPVNSLAIALRSAVASSLMSAKPDLVLITELESMLCGRLARKRVPDVPVIVDMHNVNYCLQNRINGVTVGPTKGSADSDRIYRKESQLYRWANYSFACSSEDRDLLQAANGGRLPGFVVPNGVDTSASAFVSHVHHSCLTRLIFCASLTTEANIGGLLWFYELVWPKIRQAIPDVKLLVVGNDPGNQRLNHLRQDPSLKFTGRVAALAPYYRDAGVAICPVQIGSGTRLKILEAMSFGNPIVSTSVGCEGIKLTDGEHLVIEDLPEKFASSVLRLIQQPEEYSRVSANARRLVEQSYDWNVIGTSMLQHIRSILCVQ